MTLPDPLILFIVLAPGIVAAFAGLFQRYIGDRVAMAVTTATVGTAGILSLYQLISYAFGGHHGDGHGAYHVIELARWIDVGQFQANWAIRVDAMSIVMMAVITSVSGLVHLYSWGYMPEDPHRARFFSYLSLFTFTMLMLVTADNLIQLFFGWEGVGLASYLLIGFWYHKESANSASIKAFVTNRVGDFGLALGIMACFFIFGTVELQPLLDAVKDNTFENVQPLINFADNVAPRNAAVEFLGVRVYALELIGFLLFIGAMGKSAQFILHVWLPDAMEGPTPVSALIHAATMVTAGVYLVCLMSPIYEYAPIASGFIALVGAVTALYAATVGMAQNDIKRVIAFSTCSQLGYMFFAAGIGAYQAAMFHLFTHAFFKALLFLGAGSVIHGMHHEPDMRKMGGVAPYMKVTYAAMLIGTIAIIGLGIPETKFGFSGFFSKDAIIETAFAAGIKGVTFAQLAFWFGIFAALLTSFYSWRLIYMTFHGPMAEPESHVDHHDDVHDHDAHHDHGGKPHESPLVMLIPLIVLSIGAVAAGYFFYDSFVGHHQKEFWDGAIYAATDNTVLKDKYDVHHGGIVPGWVFWVPLIVTISGFLIATFTYLFNRGVGARLAKKGGPLHSLFANKWYFDEIYEATVIRATRGLGDFFWKVVDKKIIDGFGPDGISSLARWSAGRLSAMHTGYLYHYAFVILGAAAIFGAVMLINGTGAN
jgi:NADH-quinone oxidoreductase subunit L